MAGSAISAHIPGPILPFHPVLPLSSFPLPSGNIADVSSQDPVLNDVGLLTNAGSMPYGTHMTAVARAVHRLLVPPQLRTGPSQWGQCI